MQPTPGKIRGETRDIGKPHNWDEKIHGTCGSLSVRDEYDKATGLNWMISEWSLHPWELKMLADRNGVVVLKIGGSVHPVVSLSVEARGVTPADNQKELISEKQPE